MFSNVFIEKLKYELTKGLPGKDAQLLMLPEEIRVSRSYVPASSNYRRSAVLILLYPYKKSIFTLFIERSIYKGIHSGQIAFPGGKEEKDDPDLIHTALRETYEEVGVSSESIEIIGRLTDVYIPPSNFLVAPFVGYLSHCPEFIVNSHEVNQIIRADILNASSIEKSIKKIVHSDGTSLLTPFYNIDGYTIWGATAMIMSEFMTVCDNIKNKST